MILPNHLLPNIMASPLRFLATADIGVPTDGLRELARAMAEYATAKPQHFILGLGDNFYPCGVYGVDDPQFNTVWRSIFLRYPSLNVPWYMILGNHDYDGNIDAQIAYTYDKKYNPDGLWRMPDRSYQLNVPLPGDAAHPPSSVDLFAIDSNACQFSLRWRNPKLIPQMHQQMEELKQQLKQSRADWKIALSHHPLYTQGKGHKACADCLRDASYRHPTGLGRSASSEGFGMESVLINGGVDVHIAGHEHVLQMTTVHGLHHICCGASGAEMRPGSGLYQGRNHDMVMDWVSSGKDIGFVAVEIDPHEMRVEFIRVDGVVLKQETIRKRSAEDKARQAQEFLARS